MIGRSLFWKIYLAYAGLSVASACAFVVAVSGWQEQNLRRQVTENLRNSAVLFRKSVADSFTDAPADAFQADVRRIAQQTNTRLTVIAVDGTVLADSEKIDLAGVLEMDSHHQRPELLQAAAEGSGAAQRESLTVGEPYIYYALRVDRDGESIGFVRTSLSQIKLADESSRIRRLIGLLAGGVCLAALAVTYWLASWLVQPISTLTEAAEAIADGDYRHRIHLSQQDELGQLARAFARMSDELAHREKELRQSNQQQATVLGGMVEGVIAVDPAGEIQFANEAAGKLLGVDPSVIRGKTILQSLQNQSLHRASSDAVSSRNPQRSEFRVDDPFHRDIGVHATPLPGVPCPGVVLVLDDLTEIRRLETMRQDFVANVSHELKTPLSSIKAYAETLSRGAIDDPDNKHRFVHRIEEQADRLDNLIRDLLSLARIETGREALDIVRLELGSFIESCVSEQHERAAERSIQLRFQPNSQRMYVHADEEGLRQILNNLIDNAVKYTASGGSVTVSTRKEADQAVTLVTDTGIGIAKEHQARLFERFYRVDKARSRELGGTGLGLAIVKHLSQAFGGRVGVVSEPGAGSTFSVWLPLDQ